MCWTKMQKISLCLAMSCRHYSSVVDSALCNKCKEKNDHAGEFDVSLLLKKEFRDCKEKWAEREAACRVDEA